jgi:hypothetical protein
MGVAAYMKDHFQLQKDLTARREAREAYYPSLILSPHKPITNN